VLAAFFPPFQSMLQRMGDWQASRRVVQMPVAAVMFLVAAGSALLLESLARQLLARVWALSKR
jgi:hypothetical protein